MRFITKNYVGKLLCLLLFCCMAVQVNAAYPAGSPVAVNGKLHVSGTKMVNECGYTVQLHGMSTHGPQWFPNCYCQEALQTMVDDWKINIFRYAMYVEELGYITNPSKWKQEIDMYADYCEQLGIYFLIDWHVLNPGNPNAHLNDAIDFWNYMSQKHASKKHIIYEICNEPNGGVQWSGSNGVKEYAEKIISTIRKNDPNTIIIVGTPTWSQDVDAASRDKLSDKNVMYTLHFYAGSHGQQLRQKAESAMNNGCAIFVTECGTSSASGDGSYSPDAMRQWVSWMNQHDISWCNWSFADKSEVASALSPGACNSRSWNNTTASGTLIKTLFAESKNTFQNCSSANSGDNNQQQNPNQNQNNNNNNQQQPDPNQNQNNQNQNQNNNNNNNNNQQQQTPTVTYPTLTDQLGSRKIYRIVNKKSGKVLSMKGSTQDKAALVQDARSENDESQLFELRDYNGVYTLRNVKSNMVLTNSYNPNPGAQITQQNLSEYDNPSEKWTLKKVNDKWFRLDNKAGNGTVFAVQNASYDNGAAVTQENFSSADNQLWGFEYVQDADTTGIEVLYSESLALSPSVIESEFSVYGSFESVEILNFNGSKVRAFGAQPSYNISNLPTGPYIVAVTTDAGYKEFFKVIKR
ncbi:MAG: cellulase family glycosylhydrolase [Paludibacteraceae bacterium]|nr:cellulase family glycosylhydrolase [Paludibacteraceae bacterium]